MKVFFATITSKNKRINKSNQNLAYQKKGKSQKLLSQKRHLKKPCQKKSKYCVELSNFEYYNGIFT